VIEAVAFSMLVERVAWNFKECSAAGKSQTRDVWWSRVRGLLLVGCKARYSMVAEGDDCICLFCCASPRNEVQRLGVGDSIRV
jgi:hypothetical protein